jgi:hypothetical protein
VTAESDGNNRRSARPDLLASLPAEGPPASRPDPGIDPAAIEELLTEVRSLREQVAGLREAVSAERSAPEPAPLTQEALESWGDGLVARVAEAARPEAAPEDDAAAAIADHTGRIEEAAAKAAAAAERVDRGMETTADRLAAEIEEAVTRIEKGLAATRSQVIQQSGPIRGLLYDIVTQTAGPRFGPKTVLVWLIVLVFGMLIESRALLLYKWLWSG